MSAQAWAIALEDRERARAGTSLALARQAVARRIGVAPGTLENLRRGRLTAGVRVWIAERIRAALVREIEAEIGRLTHELANLQALGLDPRGIEMGEVETHLAAVRALLKERA